ncbi:unnamed protein product, partial [marine sediment metagenome]
LLIAGTNYALSERIERNRTDKLYRQTGELLNRFNAMSDANLPKAEQFEEFAEVEITSSRGKKQVVVVVRALSADGETVVGWSFNASGSGFADKIELVVAVDKDFESIAGFDVLASNETPGFGDKIKLPNWRNQFAGAPVEELKLVKTGDVEKIDSEIVAISGATVSSKAVVDIINNSIIQIKDQMQKEELIDNGK